MVGEAPPITPKQKLEDLIRLAELCVDLLRQNEEFYAEVTLLSSVLTSFRISASKKNYFSRKVQLFKQNYYLTLKY